MDDLSRKFRSIDWKGLQKSARRVQASTASALKDMVMTDLENKVRAATADTSWGASGSDLMQIAQGTYNREDYALIMSIVWQRLGSSRWRCVFKSLEVLRHLIMHGAARCAEEARSAAHHIQTLQHFRFIDPKTKRDCGEGVRSRAKLVCDMLADDAVLEEEREKSRELRAKLQGGVSMGPGGRLGGLSSDDYRYGASGGAGGSDAYEAGVTRTSTGGVGSFKGYGADDAANGEGYDDVPTGSFAKKAGAVAGNSMAEVPDLMGDGDAGAGGAGASGVLDDDDDDDFDPRAGSGGAAPAAAGDDDLFAALAITSSAAPAHLALGDDRAQGQGGANMSTSMLVQSLAKQQSQGQLQVQPYDASAAETSSGLPQSSTQSGIEASLGNLNAQQSSDFKTGTDDDGVFQTGAGSPSLNTTTAAPPAPKYKVTAKPDADPFGDLMASAKKSGVL